MLKDRRGIWHSKTCGVCVCVYELCVCSVYAVHVCVVCGLCCMSAICICVCTVTCICCAYALCVCVLCVFVCVLRVYTHTMY